MGVFTMVVLIVFLGSVGKLGAPIARALAERISRGRPEPAGEVPALRAALEATEERLLQAEERISELDDKLRFLEGVLAGPERRGELAPPQIPPG